MTSQAGTSALAPPAAQDSAAATPVSVLLYLAALVVTLTGLFAVHIMLEEAEPEFMRLIVGLTLLGFAVSYISRRQEVSPRVIEMPAVILCVIFALSVFLSDQMLPFMAPPSATGDRGKGLAVLLAWLVVFRSFTLLTDGALLFSCVPTIALIGLVGTSHTEPILVQSYLVFIAAAAFMLVHENFLRTRCGAGRRGRAERALFAGQVQMAAACGIGAVILANFVAGPMRTVGSMLLITPALVSSGQDQQQAATTAQVKSFTERSEISVGTGPVSLSDQIVMRVQAEEGHNWRGAAFNEYTGRGWRNTLSASEYLEENPGTGDGGIFSEDPVQRPLRFTIRPTVYTAVGARSRRLVQNVRFEGASWFTEIYAAPEARLLMMGEGVAQIDPLGSIHLLRAVKGARYQVESDIPDHSPERLRRAQGPFPPEIAENFIRLNSISPAVLERLRQQALQVTQGAASDYDRVVALKEWVASQCKYNLRAKAVPGDADVAEHFLFVQKEGYCDLFATSLAMLCRSLGIPARVASGFLAGTQDASTGEFVVRERDKHQWTEVYFAGVGWIPFDATEGAEDITGLEEEEQRRRGGWLGALFRRGLLPPLALLAFLGMLAYVIKVEILDRLRPRRARPGRDSLPETNAAIVEAYLCLTRLLGQRGFPREPFQTPAEHLEAARARLDRWPELQAALDRLTALVTRYRYSAETATEDDVRRAQEALAAGRRALKSVSRRAILSAAPAPETA